MCVFADALSCQVFFLVTLPVANTRGNCNCESLKVVSFEVVEELQEIFSYISWKPRCPSSPEEE